VALASALAGCSGGVFGPKEEPRVDPNLFPSNYKTELVRYLETNPASYENTRETYLATPVLKPFGGGRTATSPACSWSGRTGARRKMLIY